MAVLADAEAPGKAGKLSYEDFLEQTDENAHVEWVNGEALAMSPISNRH